MRVEEVSIGDYVLAGGEPAVLVMTEAVGRLLPGVLGNAESAADDSFGFDGGSSGGPMAGLVEGPAYTRPRSLAGPGGAARAALRRPRGDRPLAAGHGAAADRREPARPRRPATRARPSSASGQAAELPGRLSDHDRDVLSRGWLSGHRRRCGTLKGTAPPLAEPPGGCRVRLPGARPDRSSAFAGVR